MIKVARIGKLLDGKYRVYSGKGKNLGTYSTYMEARKRLTQIEMFKHIKFKRKKAWNSLYNLVKTSEDKIFHVSCHVKLHTPIKPFDRKISEIETSDPNEIKVWMDEQMSNINVGGQHEFSFIEDGEKFRFRIEDVFFAITYGDLYFRFFPYTEKLTIDEVLNHMQEIKQSFKESYDKISLAEEKDPETLSATLRDLRKTQPDQIKDFLRAFQAAFEEGVENQIEEDLEETALMQAKQVCKIDKRSSWVLKMASDKYQNSNFTFYVKCIIDIGSENYNDRTGRLEDEIELPFTKENEDIISVWIDEKLSKIPIGMPYPQYLNSKQPPTQQPFDNTFTIKTVWFELYIKDAGVPIIWEPYFPLGSKWISSLEVIFKNFHKEINRYLALTDEELEEEFGIKKSSSLQPRLLKLAQSVIQMGQPELAGKGVAEIVKFLMQRIPASKQQQTLAKLRDKIWNLDEREIASKKSPATASLGQSITFIKTVLQGHSPEYIRSVLASTVKYLY